MRITWRNGIACFLVGVAIVQLVLGVPTLVAYSAAPHPGVAGIGGFLTALSDVLVGPAYLLAWAAAVEYLSRIASALQARRD